MDWKLKKGLFLLGFWLAAIQLFSAMYVIARLDDRLADIRADVESVKSDLDRITGKQIAAWPDDGDWSKNQLTNRPVFDPSTGKYYFDGKEIPPPKQ